MTRECNAAGNRRIDRFLNRLRILAHQPSTWRGVILMLTGFGCVFSTEQKEAIITSGLLLSGLIGASTSD
jgi:hypothetical protein